MFVFANVLLGLARVLDMVLQVYFWMLIGRAIISWVNADPRNPIVRFLRSVTDPPVELIRRLLPARLRHYPLDIAFLALMGLVLFAQVAVVQTLHDVGLRLRQPSPAAEAAPR
ncbi:MAG TPA: YggT family protein [Vicinamibacteria bacterium]